MAGRVHDGDLIVSGADALAVDERMRSQPNCLTSTRGQRD
jgi:hypothetical protein